MIWMEVPDYEGRYLINRSGVVKSTDRKVHKWDGERTILSRIITHHYTRQGYVRVSLSKNGRTNKISLHRILGVLFIPNPENKPQINHKNGVKSDNRIENLEWVTRSENQLHAFRVLKCYRPIRPKGRIWFKDRGLPCPTKRAVVMINRQTKDKTNFDSLTEAGASLNKHATQIRNYIIGTRRNKIYKPRKNQFV